MEVVNFRIFLLCLIGLLAFLKAGTYSHSFQTMLIILLNNYMDSQVCPLLPFLRIFVWKKIALHALHTISMKLLSDSELEFL